MDWKKIVQVVAPSIGTALGGPLAGAAVRVLGAAILGDEGASEEKVAEQVLQGLSPEIMMELKKADQAFAIRMRELEIDVDRLNGEMEKAYLSDTQDARKAHAGEIGVFRLGLAVLAIFGVVLISVLIGSFQIVTGGITVKDAATVGLVSGLVGTVVGYAAANAQQVVAYFFGSSRGSQAKSDQMASAIERLGKRQ